MKNIILEGARGTGKSTLSRWLRNHLLNSTLINFTGFNENGEKGLSKVVTYYDNWNNFFRSMKNAKMDVYFIHDRYYFSEMVYSKLYKDYDFTEKYLNYINSIPAIFEEIILFFFYTNDGNVLARNLTRDKEKLFGNVDESVNESFLQQFEYKVLFNELRLMNIPNLKIINVDVSNKEISQIGNELLSYIQ